MLDVETNSHPIISKYHQYLSLYKSYYSSFINLISNVIYEDEDSSFSFQYKLYYGIMASSTMNNIELFDDFKKKFLECNGDKLWVEQGIQCENIPKQIKLFANINDILAHKPWFLHWTHFIEFDNGLSFFLFQSAIILTTIQRFATIISALELFLKKNITINDLIFQNEEDNLKNNEIENKIKKKNSKRDEKIKSENEKVIISVKQNYIDEKDLNEKKKQNTNNNFSIKFLLKEPVIYEDFNQHHDKYLYVDDFDWKTNAKYFYVDYASKEMDFLEKEFKALDTLSNNEKNKNNIFKHKNTIEKYVEIILGIRDREYDYHKTNEVLNMDIKNLIKKIACFPEKLNDENLDDLLLILNAKNLLILIFIIAEIKQKISLTYFAKAFDDFSSNKNKFDYNKI